MDYSHRSHNSTLYATYHAIKAVIPPGAPPPARPRCALRDCDRGDGSPASKETARQRWAHVNAGHVADIARLGSPPHAYELKVYTPYNQTVALGLVGSERNGGAPSTAEGHIHAFGCTEAKLCKLVFGLKQVGIRDDAPYDRVTGAGFVAACNWQYATRCLRVFSLSPSSQRQVRANPLTHARVAECVVRILHGLDK